MTLLGCGNVKPPVEALVVHGMLGMGAFARKAGMWDDRFNGIGGNGRRKPVTEYDVSSRRQVIEAAVIMIKEHSDVTIHLVLPLPSDDDPDSQMLTDAWVRAINIHAPPNVVTVVAGTDLFGYAVHLQRQAVSGTFVGVINGGHRHGPGNAWWKRGGHARRAMDEDLARRSLGFAVFSRLVRFPANFYDRNHRRAGILDQVLGGRHIESLVPSHALVKDALGAWFPALGMPVVELVGPWVPPAEVILDETFVSVRAAMVDPVAGEEEGAESEEPELEDAEMGGHTVYPYPAAEYGSLATDLAHSPWPARPEHPAPEVITVDSPSGGSPHIAASGVAICWKLDRRAVGKRFPPDL